MAVAHYLQLDLAGFKVLSDFIGQSAIHYVASRSSICQKLGICRTGKPISQAFGAYLGRYKLFELF